MAVAPRGDVSLLGPAEIRELAAALGLRPSKSRGQNFVHDANTIRRIVATADLSPGEMVLEVGPGLGSLTLGLVAGGASVTAVEIEPALGGELATTMARHGAPADAVRVIVADALQLPGLPGPTPSALVANLPYNVGVPVLLHLLGVVSSLSHGVVLVQSEVADRLVAAPGSRCYGVPSVKLSWFAAARRAGSVPRAVFWPVPGVDSALVRWWRRAPPAYLPSWPGPPVERRAVFAVVDTAFQQRRKALRAALAGIAGSAAAAERALQCAGIDPTRRGETLDVEEFARLTSALRAAGASLPGGTGGIAAQR